MHAFEICDLEMRLIFNDAEREAGMRDERKQGTLFSCHHSRTSPHTTQQATRHSLPTVGPYECPVDLDVMLPMVMVDDLMRGLIALQEADESKLLEPEHGYAIPGLSFTPNMLFAEIRKHYPNFQVSRFSSQIFPSFVSALSISDLLACVCFPLSVHGALERKHEQVREALAQ